jgi:uncharacterized protein YdaT
MPWTPEEFRSRHAKHLTPQQAKLAASQANAMLRSGASEGIAIAIAIKNAKTMHRNMKGVLDRGY